jgi:hypothetical protein
MTSSVHAGLRAFFFEEIAVSDQLSALSLAGKRLSFLTRLKADS